MQAAVVCDAQFLFAESFAAALARNGVEVAGVTTAPDDAVRLLEGLGASTVVMDLGAPGARGLRATAAICTRWPGSQVFCLTPEADTSLAAAALSAGAAAVMSKTSPLEELVTAVVSGFAPRGSRWEPAADGEPEPLAAKFLTVRERDVLHLLVAGRSTAAIARDLQISVATARGYVQSILIKLGVHSRVEAVGYAVRHCVVDPSTVATLA